MKAREPVSHRELVMHLEGEVTLARALEIRAAVAQDPATAAAQQDLLESVASLRAGDDTWDGVDLVDGVRHAVAQEQRAQRARTWRVLPVWAAGAVMGAAAVMALGFNLRPMGGDGFAPKGGAPAQWTGIQAFKEHANEGAQPLGNHMCAQDALMFSYSSAAKLGANQLMVFGLDAVGNVHWYYPAFEDPGSNPASVPLAVDGTRHELLEKIKHTLVPGAVTLFGVFTTQPWRVSQVEDAVNALKAQHGFDGEHVPNLNLPAVLVQEIPVTVTPCLR